MLRLTQQPLRTRLVRAGLAQVVNRFSLGRMVSRTQDLYHRVIAERLATVERTGTDQVLAGETRR